MTHALSQQPRLARRAFALWLGVAFGFGRAHAGVPVPLVAASRAESAGDVNVSDWLLHVHDAARTRNYVGTFVVSSIDGAMSSARIWHAYDGHLQVERVETLTGAPRSVFRRNEQVVTFLPESHVVRTEHRDSLGVFTNLLKSGNSAVGDFYAARRLGSDRVAGFETDVIQLVPRDALRYGYRIWSERRSGLVVKLQTVDADGTVLEQSAFSELVLDAPVRTDRLSQMMSATGGWRVEQADAVRTTAEAEGWQLKTPVPGFKPISCYKRPVAGVTPDRGMQWVFSDGLAAVSLFLEPYDAKRHVKEGMFVTGATQTLTHRVHDAWLTAVGEVPAAALRAFAQSIEPRR